MGNYLAEHDPTRGTFWAGRKESDAEDTAREANKDWTAESQANEKKLQGADTAYTDQMRGNTQAAQEGISKLSGQAAGAQTDARQTYTTQIQPQLKNQMERAQGNAGGAMSLQQAMDVNNPVATQTRGLYENQADNENRRNLASTGIMQAMGARSFSDSLAGAGPMTGGQLQALMAGNQAQASNQYMRDQLRTQNLRDTGLNMGFERSDKAYNQGVDAQDRYRRSIGDYEAGQDRQLGRDAGFRSEQGGYTGDMYNLGTSQTGLEHNVAGSQAARKEALLGRQYGNTIAGANAIAAREAAAREKKMDMIGGGAGGLIKTLGGLGGGAAGAAGGAGGNGNPKNGARGGQGGGGDITADGEEMEHANTESDMGNEFSSGNEYYDSSNSYGGASQPGMSLTGSPNPYNSRTQTRARTDMGSPNSLGSGVNPYHGAGENLGYQRQDFTAQRAGWQAQQAQTQAAEAAAQEKKAADAQRAQQALASMGSAAGRVANTLPSAEEEERRRRAAIRATQSQGYASGQVAE